MATARGSALRSELPGLALLLGFFVLQYRAVFFCGQHWLFGDNSFQNFPWHYFVWDRVRHGGLTGPCLEMSLGFPLVAEPQVQAFYPFNTALWPIGDPFASFTLKLVLHMLAATLGLYVLARQLGRSPLAAAAAAAVLGGSSFMVYRLVHAPLLFSLAWLPWIALLFLRARVHRSRLAAVGLVGTCAMQVLTGHPQLTLYTFVVALVLAATQRAHGDGEKTGRWWLRSAGLLLAAYGAGLVIAMVQVAPTYELYLYGARTGGVEAGLVRQWGCSLRDLGVDFLARATAQWKTEKVAFPGSLAWVAILYALGRRDRLSVGLLALVGLGLLLSWSDTNPLYDVIAFLPVVNKFRAPGRIGLLLVIGAALLFAQWLDDLRRPKAARSGWAIVGTLALFEAVALLTARRPGLWPLGATDPLGWQLVVLLAALLALGAVKVWPKLTPGLAPTLLLLAMVEMALHGVGEFRPVTREQWLNDPNQRIYQVAAEHARQRPGAFVRWRDGLPDNVSIYYGLPQTRSYSPMLSEALETLNTYFYGPNRPAVLAAFGVRWVATTAEYARQEGLRPVATVGPWLLCESPAPPLTAYMPRELVPGDFTAALTLLANQRTDPRETAVVPANALGGQPVFCPDGRAEVLEEQPGHLVVRTRTSQPGLLVVTRLWTPYWSATVDGQPVATTHSYSFLLAAPTAPGEHTVVLDYAMPLLRPALVSTLATLAWLACLVVEIRRARLSSREAGGPCDAC